NGLTIIQQSGQHLLTLINDILDLAKIEAGRLELALTPLHLPSFLDGIVGIIRTRAQAKQLTLPFEAPPSLPERVLSAETRLRQVLLNLLSNAVKFTDRGQVSLRVTTTDHRPPTTDQENQEPPRGYPPAGSTKNPDADSGSRLTLRVPVLGSRV